MKQIILSLFRIIGIALLIVITIFLMASFKFLALTSFLASTIYMCIMLYRYRMTKHDYPIFRANFLAGLKVGDSIHFSVDGYVWDDTIIGFSDDRRMVNLAGYGKIGINNILS